jgi:hypothetical protein
MGRPRTPLHFRLADLEPGTKLFGSCDRYIVQIGENWGRLG